MPPKARITKEMIVNAAFEIARETGAENINARTISEKLGCSTQPVMWHFAKISDIKKAAYEKADSFHTEFIMNTGSNSMREIGLNYIRFAAVEKNLFRFIFQSNEFSGKTLLDLTEANEVRPILEILAQTAGTDLKQAAVIFRTLFLYVHGYASMLANNAMKYDEAEVSEELELLFERIGAIV